MIEIFSDYSCFLKDYFSVLLLIHLTIIIGILLSAYTFRKTSIKVCDILNIKNDDTLSRLPLIVLLFLCGLILFFYLLKVNLFDTGLYHMFVGSKMQALAREYSLKTNENRATVYFYALLKNIIAPITYLFLLDNWIKQKKEIFYLFCIPIIVIFSNLNGEKSFLLVYALLTGFYFLYRSNTNHNYRKILFFGVIVFMSIIIPSIFFGVKIGEFSTLVISKLERAFLIPLKVGLWYIHDAQYNGFNFYDLLPGTIKWLVNPDYINYANYIGQKYFGYYQGYKTISSVNANAGFIFYFYKGAGFWAVPFSIALVLSLDFLILMYKKMPKNFLVITIAFVTVNAISFVSSNFYTCVFSHGLILGVLLLKLLSFDFNRLFEKYTLRFRKLRS